MLRPRQSKRNPRSIAAAASPSPIGRSSPKLAVLPEAHAVAALAPDARQSA